MKKWGFATAMMKKMGRRANRPVMAFGAFISHRLVLSKTTTPAT